MKAVRPILVCLVIFHSMLPFFNLWFLYSGEFNHPNKSMCNADLTKGAIQELS